VSKSRSPERDDFADDDGGGARQVRRRRRDAGAIRDQGRRE
jgi:hypothetical protein